MMIDADTIISENGLHYDSDSISSIQTSVWSMGDNSRQFPFDDNDVTGISSSTETWSWGDSSSCYSTLTSGSSTDKNISDVQKLRALY